MRLRVMVSFVMFVSLLLAGASAASGPGLDVQLRLEPATIVLGQPVWVVVSMTNRSASPIVAQGASNCFDSPLHVEIPAAQTPNTSASMCGHPAESCQTELVHVAPGQTVERRFVLKGDFKITRAGRYAVVIHDAVRYGDSTAGASAQTNLTVMPSNHDKLLAIEQSLARRALAAPIAERYELAAGLATYPAAGMEAAFTSWANRQDVSDFALLALYHLNTPQARATLAQCASGTPALWADRNRAEAVRYLAHMGDASYLPVLQKLAHDPEKDVQRQAVLGIGVLTKRVKPQCPVEA
jgi:hypothetical protein